MQILISSFEDLKSASKERINAIRLHDRFVEKQGGYNEHGFLAKSNKANDLVLNNLRFNIIKTEHVEVDRAQNLYQLLIVRKIEFEAKEMAKILYDPDYDLESFLCAVDSYVKKETL